jgi:type IV pilus assembly protein PilP
MACASVFVLAACGGESHQDLRVWMSEQGKGARGKLDPLPQIKPYDPFAYNAFDLPDPFKPRKIEPTKGASKLAPDLTRRKEPLEAYPLESLAMVGTLERNKTTYALVRTPDRDIYQIRAGNYLGQNFGVVTGIGESEIKLKELIQDGAGDWTERSSTLQLQQERIRHKHNRDADDERGYRHANYPDRVRATEVGRPALVALLNFMLAGALYAQTGNSLENRDQSRARARAAWSCDSSSRRRRPILRELLDSQPAAHRARLPRHHRTTWARPQRPVDEAALRKPQRDPGPDNRTRVVFNLNKAAVVRDLGRGSTGRRHADRPGAIRPGQAPCSGSRRRSRATSSMRCATSTSVADATVKDGSWSTCRTRRPASTYASRARRSSSTSSRRRSRATSSGASTSPTSARR